ncbi:multicopper oxidase (plasmid) [Natrinema zhouii]|uniref:multicopper oxidase family protein n=1 Tax=Natrinema zhouii TaxID=1710539 RepID=UPI001CFF8916|nr:multicopper oxidase [Natrinema zhouii]UHQ99061.1 multicopper oxidase [Natrinema zhouii]
MGDQTEPTGPSISRRELCIAAGATGISALAGCSAPTNPSRAESATTITDHSSPDLEKWVDEVPRPGVVEPSGTKDGQPQYEIEMREVEQKLHRDLPATTVWGYDGQFPGPTIEAEQGEPIYVRWTNGLPDEHLLPVDTTIHSDIIPYDMPGVRTVTHLHGGNVESESDGHAQAWYTRNFEETGPEFQKKDYYYVNDQPPATLWYHDHSLGITRLNVYAGLAGFYLLRNDHERSLDLPEGEYEIPLVFQDRSFEEDGSLFYPTAISDEQAGSDESLPDPSIVPQFYGDTSVVNGKAWPRLSVEPRSYRFRLLNGSNSRYYTLKLRQYDESSGEAGDDGPSFVQIGNDGGLLSTPVEIEDRLELGAGQRADVVVDFAEHAGETLLLHNDAPAQYRGRTGLGDDDDIVSLPEIMVVDVGDDGNSQDASEVPDELTRVPDIPVDSVDNERYLTLNGGATDDYGRLLHLLGTADERDGLEIDDPVTEEPTLGDTEIWSFANRSSMSHPMHLHLVHFQMLGRQSMGDYDPDEDEIDLEALEAPEPYERGWNDVITVDPGEIVHVIVHFGEHDGLFNDQTGTYMWHCHMIEHEDHDMMRPFTVRPNDGDGDDNDDSTTRR